MERLRRLKGVTDVQARLRDRAFAAGARAQVAIEALKERERALLRTLDAEMLPAFLVPSAIARLSRSAAERHALQTQKDVAHRSALQHGRLARAGERLSDRLRADEEDNERRRALEEHLAPNVEGQPRESRRR